MKGVKTLLISLVICSLVFSGAAAQGEGDATIRGSVTNNTPNGAVPTGAPVTLQFFDEGTWTNIYTNTLQTDGTFLFTDLESEVGNDFVTRIVYGEVEYFSEPAVFEGEIEVEILIYEPTDNAALIQVDQAHFFIVPSANTIQVAEYYLIGNSGDRAFVGTLDAATGVRTTINFAPPKGAINLTFDGPGLGERFIGDEMKFSDTRAIPPGNATIEVSFVYDFSEDQTLTIERVMEIPIESVVFIVSGGDVGLQGPGLEFSGIMDTQMGPAASYSVGPLAALDPLAFTLVPLMEDQPAQPVDNTPAEPSPRTRDAGVETGVGVVTLIVASLISYQIWKAPTRVAMPKDAQPLLLQMAELDNNYELDGTDRVSYMKQRAALKQRIRALLRKQ